MSERPPRRPGKSMVVLMLSVEEVADLLAGLVVHGHQLLDNLDGKRLLQLPRPTAHEIAAAQAHCDRVGKLGNRICETLQRTMGPQAA